MFHTSENGKRRVSWHERYKVRAGHTLESLPLPSHCCTVLRARWRQKDVWWILIIWKFEEQESDRIEAFVALSSSCHLWDFQLMKQLNVSSVVSEPSHWPLTALLVMMVLNKLKLILLFYSLHTLLNWAVSPVHDVMSLLAALFLSFLRKRTVFVLDLAQLVNGKKINYQLLASKMSNICFTSLRNCCLFLTGRLIYN